MKKTIFLAISICFSLMLNAQVLKTVNITAGSLAIQLTTEEKITVANLTITGTIDARDFVILRDSIPMLAVLDISGTEVIAYNGAVGIDQNIMEYPANEIPQEALSYCSNLTSITFPTSITLIGARVFIGCNGLKLVTFPMSVTSIGNFAFANCTSLTSIEIPSKVTFIENNAFMGSGCLFMVDKNNPNYSSVDGVLFNKTQTKLIQCPISKTGTYIIPLSVTSIGDQAFYSCKGLTSVIIPLSVTSIGTQTFIQCTGLISIDIPSTVTSIGSGAFTSCIELTSIIIPPSVTYIESDTFFNCKGLTSIDIPSSITSIKQFAFLDCSGLTSITIPSSVTSIEHLAFSGCFSLPSIKIPSSVTNIGYDAFLDCGALIIVDSNNSIYSSIDGVLFNKTKTSLIYCPISKSGSYNIPSTVSSIGNHAFMKCTGLTSIDIPSTVASIGEAAFYGCTGLTSVTIPSSVTSIESNTFYGCKGLTTVTVPTSVTSIGFNAFGGCSSLTSINIPSSVIAIRGSAFAFCLSLTSITIPEGVNSIEYYAFWGCSGLTSILALGKIPIDISASSDVFYNVNKTSCTLYVPKGSINAYQSANQWKDFTNIVEISYNIPIANAGSAQSVNEGATTTLDGSQSSDPDSDPLTYKWTAPAGITLSSTTVQKPTFTAQEVCNDTNYTLTLVVNDGKTDSPVDQVMITVKHINIVPIASITQPDCYMQTGTIMVSYPAAGAGISYTITGINPVVAPITNATGIFAGLATGVYDVTTTNASGCISTALNITINTYIIQNLPVFIQIDPLCQNSVAPVLPICTTNTPAICGIWSPATISTTTVGTTTYTFTPDAGQYSSSTTMDITIEGQIIPLFAAIAPLCQNSIAPLLPNSSFNIPAITGSWSPAKISTATSGTMIYTFTPDAGQCATTATLSIEITTPSVANAGSAQSVNEGATTTLDGSQSSDPDSDPLTYKWTAPAGIILSSATAAKPTFTAPEVSTNTNYTFTLVVNDGIIDSNPSTVNITVLNVIKVGFEILAENELKVYPNPASQMVWIEIPDITKFWDLTILTITGEIISSYKISSAKTGIDISNLTSGAYFFQFENKEEWIIRKIIKD